MSRVIAGGAGIFLVAVVGLIVMQRGADEGQESAPNPKESVAATTESGLPDATAVAESKPVAPLTSPKKDIEKAQRRSGDAEAGGNAEHRREAIARIADLGYNDFEANRIRDAWEEAEEKALSCREEIMKGENGSLEFGAMRACDRSHMSALYDALGDPDDYRAALVGADRMTRVEIGVVGTGEYAISLGLQKGDQIIQWDDQEVFEPADMRAFRRGLSDSNEPVTLVIFRPPGEIFEIETIGGRTGAAYFGQK